LGRELMHSAAYWADAHGATHLTILVTKANEAANALYRGLGMTAIGGYHYRVQS
jgi:ribosomal protein S18 acetylase RimI-like enzyme